MRLSIHRLSSSFLLLMICSMPGASAYAVPRYWTVVEVSGAVEIKDAAKSPLSTQIGSHLQAPFTILTGADGRALISHGLDKLSIGPGTQVSIPKPTTADTGVITRIKQILGSVLYQVEHRVKDSFEVDTPYLVSVVKGTTFNIRSTSNDTTVALIEGRVLVYTPDRKHQLMLKPGQAAIKSIRSRGIILKDQQAMSAPVKGSITIVRSGEAPDALMPTSSLRSGTAALDGIKSGETLTNIGDAITMTSNRIDDSSAAIGGSGLIDLSAGLVDGSATVGLDGGSLVDVNSSITDVSASASTGGGDVLDIGANVSDMSASAAIGGGSLADVGATVADVSTSTSVGGSSLIDLGATVSDVSVSTTIGGDSLVDVNASVAGTSTGIDLGGGTTTTATPTTSTSSTSVLDPVNKLTGTVNLTLP